MPDERSEFSPLDSDRTQNEDGRRLTRPQQQFADVLGTQLARSWAREQSERTLEAGQNGPQLASSR